MRAEVALLIRRDLDFHSLIPSVLPCLLSYNARRYVVT
jgi:hypothetical protein